MLSTIPGIGPVLGLTIAAEIGDVARFPSPRKPIGYSGLAPRVKQSGERSRSGELLKAGSRTLRFAAVEAAQGAWRETTPWHRLHSDVKARTGKANPAKSAVARKVLIACWHVLSSEEPFKPRHPQTDPVPASSLCFLAARRPAHKLRSPDSSYPRSCAASAETEMSVRRRNTKRVEGPNHSKRKEKRRRPLATRGRTAMNRSCRVDAILPDLPIRTRMRERGRPMRVVVINHLTLDGVMQAPGRPEEDTRGGFKLGGWAGPNIDDVVNAAMGARMPRSDGLLLGRRSYEDMLSYWNTQDSPFKDMLNSAPKYVASRTLREPLPWPNSTLLDADVAHAVAQLRQQPGRDLNVMGSGELIQTLMREDLIDEYLLLIHPLVLGAGRRLFGDGGPPASLRLVDSTVSTTGVLIATYQPEQLN